MGIHINHILVHTDVDTNDMLGERIEQDVVPGVQYLITEVDELVLDDSWQVIFPKTALVKDGNVLVEDFHAGIGTSAWNKIIDGISKCALVYELFWHSVSDGGAIYKIQNGERQLIVECLENDNRENFDATIKDLFGYDGVVGFAEHYDEVWNREVYEKKIKPEIDEMVAEREKNKRM